MNGTPTYGTLREAILSIKETWPDAASWLELDKVAGLMPEDPAPGDPASGGGPDPVKRLLERLPEPGDFIPAAAPRNNL